MTALSRYTDFMTRAGLLRVCLSNARLLGPYRSTITGLTIAVLGIAAPGCDSETGTGESRDSNCLDDCHSTGATADDDATGERMPASTANTPQQEDASPQGVRSPEASDAGAEPSESRDGAAPQDNPEPQTRDSGTSESEPDEEAAAPEEMPSQDRWVAFTADPQGTGNAHLYAVNGTAPETVLELGAAQSADASIRRSVTWVYGGQLLSFSTTSDQRFLAPFADEGPQTVMALDEFFGRSLGQATRLVQGGAAVLAAERIDDADEVMERFTLNVFATPTQSTLLYQRTRPSSGNYLEPVLEDSGLWAYVQNNDSLELLALSPDATWQTVDAVSDASLADRAYATTWVGAEGLTYRAPGISGVDECFWVDVESTAIAAPVRLHEPLSEGQSCAYSLVAPDGRSFSFTLSDDAGRHLYYVPVINGGAGSPVLVASGADLFIHPWHSADSARLIVADLATASDPRLMIADVRDGAGNALAAPTELVAFGLEPGEAASIHSSLSIVAVDDLVFYTAGPGATSHKLYAANARAGSEPRLLLDMGEARIPSFIVSPDGKKVAVVTAPPATEEMPAPQGRVRLVVTTEADVEETDLWSAVGSVRFTWSPSSTALTIGGTFSDTPSSRDLHLVGIGDDGSLSDPVLLVSDSEVGDIWEPAWQP